MIRMTPWTKDYEQIPKELRYIQSTWAHWQNSYGDVGSCVLGAGFTFEYQGEFYEMPPVGRTQGSISWEHYKDQIHQMLRDIGAINIEYHWGMMD